LLILAGAGALSIFVLGDQTSSRAGGREISWQEFQGQLLETGLVDRIIVSNKQTARVVLRAPAGLAAPGAAAGGGDDVRAPVRPWALTARPANGTGAGAVGTGYPAEGAAYGADGGFEADGGFGNAGPSGGPGAAPDKFARYPRLGSPNPTQGAAPFHFAIGSVESFERKLEVRY
jgi:hypothetical protein